MWVWPVCWVWSILGSLVVVCAMINVGIAAGTMIKRREIGVKACTRICEISATQVAAFLDIFPNQPSLLTRRGKILDTCTPNITYAFIEGISFRTIAIEINHELGIPMRELMTNNIKGGKRIAARPIIKFRIMGIGLP